jgi:hypothetical protein
MERQDWMSRKTWVVSVLVCAIVCGTTACGKKQEGEAPPAPVAEPAAEPTAGAAGEIDACALLAPADIQAITGLAVAGSGNGAAGSRNVCEFDLGEPNQLLVTAYASAAKETYDNGPGTPLAGVGDQAKFEPSSRMITVLKGDRAFVVGLLVFSKELPEEQLLDQLKQLAAKILEKL